MKHSSKTPRPQSSLGGNEESSVVTRAFTLSPYEARLIGTVRDEEHLLSDSAALRRLIRDGEKYRDLMRQAEAEAVRNLRSGSAR